MNRNSLLKLFLNVIKNFFNAMNIYKIETLTLSRNLCKNPTFFFEASTTASRSRKIQHDRKGCEKMNFLNFAR